MIKVVITGSNGLLGQSLLNVLLKEKNNYDVYGFSKGVNRSGRNDFQYISIDITNQSQLTKELLKIKPDYIVNTAAMTQVDACENDKVKCDTLNVNVVQWLAAICQELSAHLVHLSTDFIFDGKKGWYKETDVPNPLSNQLDCSNDSHSC